MLWGVDLSCNIATEFSARGSERSHVEHVRQHRPEREVTTEL